MVHDKPTRQGVRAICARVAQAGSPSSRSPSPVSSHADLQHHTSPPVLIRLAHRQAGSESGKPGNVGLRPPSSLRWRQSACLVLLAERQRLTAFFSLSLRVKPLERRPAPRAGDDGPRRRQRELSGQGISATEPERREASPPPPSAAEGGLARSTFGALHCFVQSCLGLVVSWPRTLPAGGERDAIPTRPAPPSAEQPTTLPTAPARSFS
jgi:hypothetical protein